jgi:hypothetical protein
MPKPQFGGTKEQKDTIRKITIKGTSATVIAGQKFASNYSDSGGGKHRMTSDATFKEQWVIKSGTWRLRRVEIVDHSDTIDGKTVRPNR